MKHLGRAVSHGCVRLSPDHAATLFNLVKAEGMGETKVVVTGRTPGGDNGRWRVRVCRGTRRSIRSSRSRATASTYRQPGYGQPNYGQPNYAQPGYAQPYGQRSPVTASRSSGQSYYAQQGYAQPGYAQPGYAAAGYAQPGYYAAGLCAAAAAATTASRPIPARWSSTDAFRQTRRLDQRQARPAVFPSLQRNRFGAAGCCIHCHRQVSRERTNHAARLSF